jgi:hypothetical protein
VSSTTETLEVLAPGTPIEFIHSAPTVFGEVASIRIGPELNILYFVIWWSRDDRKEDWVNAFEIKAVNEPTPIKIGFKPS